MYRKKRLKQISTEHIKRYVQTIDKYKGEVINDDNFVTGSLTILRRSLTDVLTHCGDDSKVLEWLKDFSRDSIKGWKYIGWLECQPYQPDHPKYDPKDPNKPKHPEAECFNYYMANIRGKNYYVSVKMHKMLGAEVLYVITENMEYEVHKGVRA